MRRATAVIALGLTLAACAQAPAPVRVAGSGAAPGNPSTAGGLPPLPPPLPAFRLAQLMAVPIAPLPREKPPVPGAVTVAAPPETTLPDDAPAGELPLASVAAALLEPAAPQPPADPPRQAAVGYVTVLPGDTVYAVSRRYDVAVKDVIALNDLKEPYTLFVGQDLRLPSQRYHTVAPGESLIAIAARYDKPASDLIEANELEPPYGLFVGQRLAIPGIAADGTTVAPAAAQNESVAAAAVPTEVAMPSRGSLQFIWPVDGTVLSTFGAKGDGLQNDGINIGAPAGAPVRAAEQGIVAYVGDELRGFGNLILIKHAEGWVTAYAHNSEVRVARGQQVERGQVIGTVGATGSVGVPQSHFELRRDGSPVDPLDYLVRL